MNEIVSILKEIKVVLTEIRNGITEITGGADRDDSLVHVGDTIYDTEGRAMIVTQVDADTFQAEYID